MNFNYSYKAFLITLLLVGGLYLILYFTVLPRGEAVVNEEEFEIEYAKEDPVEDKKTASVSSEKTKIETHKVFNEAEDFIKNIENNRVKNSDDLDKKLSEIDNAIGDSKNNRTLPIKKEKLTSEKNENNPASEKVLETSNNKNTTNSYRLLNRKVTYFPNPIYTCEGYGKVVLHIKVNALGKVTVAELIENSSTTTNACLIESAINYAKKARFTKDKNKPLQMGSITYVFPGQK